MKTHTLPRLAPTCYRGGGSLSSTTMISIIYWPQYGRAS